MRFALLATLLAAAVCVPSLSSAAMADDEMAPSGLLNANPHLHHPSSFAGDGGNKLGNKGTGSVLGLDTIPNFSSYFYRDDSAPYFQFTWPYTMVGNPPFAKGSDDDWQGGTTWIGAPIVPVTMELLDFDGSTRIVGGKPMISTATQLVDAVLKSPVFSRARYTSSASPTQFTDAVHRAQFFNASADEWHTMLRPRVTAPVTMKLKRGTYSFARNADGTCCAFVLIEINAFANGLFPATPDDATTPIGFAESAAMIRTKDISTFLFNNAFLFFGKPDDCCVIGFHTYDVEPGSKANGFREKRYVLNFSSWVSPGAFGDPTFADISALSHELAETFSDPFVNNLTPFWLAPNGLCQNNIESGDVIEGLPGAQIAIVTNGVVYHPQNEALLQWFAGLKRSSAVEGAFSYPDTTLLTSSAKVQLPGCP
jgi:hypothetical protein